MSSAASGVLIWCVDDKAAVSAKVSMRLTHSLRRRPVADVPATSASAAERDSMPKIPTYITQHQARAASIACLTMWPARSKRTWPYSTPSCKSMTDIHLSVASYPCSHSTLFCPAVSMRPSPLFSNLQRARDACANAATVPPYECRQVISRRTRCFIRTPLHYDNESRYTDTTGTRTDRCGLKVGYSRAFKRCRLGESLRSRKPQ